MLDDVVGLFMVQIISSLGAGSSSFDAVTVLRPVGVSLAFAIVVPLCCWLMVKPLAGRLRYLGRQMQRMVSGMSQVGFMAHTTILVGFVVVSSYAGSSNLFAAYLAGAAISWYDSNIANARHESPISPWLNVAKAATASQEKVSRDLEDDKKTQQSAAQPVDAISETDGHIPKPHMLLSPVASETGEPHTCKRENHFADEETEDGLTYGKRHLSASIAFHRNADLSHAGTRMSTWEQIYEMPITMILKPLFFASIGFSIPLSKMFTRPVVWRGFVYAILTALGKLLCGIWLIRFLNNTSTASEHAQGNARSLPKPKSLYPASILGFAMVARGEISFLISAVADSRGIFSSVGETSSELFLIVTWALMLCTIAGPIAVGLLTRRVRRLQEEKERAWAEEKIR